MKWLKRVVLAVATSADQSMQVAYSGTASGMDRMVGPDFEAGLVNLRSAAERS